MKYDDLKLMNVNWVKSSFSNNGPSCVEVAKVSGHYAVRDTKNHAAGVLLFDKNEWDAFKAGVQAGEFD